MQQLILHRGPGRLPPLHIHHRFADMRAHEVTQRLLKKRFEGATAAHAMIGEDEQVIRATVMELATNLIQLAQAGVNAAQGAQGFG